MRWEGEARTPEAVGGVDARIAQFMADRGYSPVSQSAGEAVFRRGSLRGTLTSSFPKKWAVQAIVHKAGSAEMRVVLDVNTTGQTVTEAERAFWDQELGAVLSVIEGREPVSMAPVEAKVTESTKRLILLTMAYSAAGAVLCGTLQLALHAFGIELFPGFAGIGAGIGAALGSQRGAANAKGKP